MLQTTHWLSLTTQPNCVSRVRTLFQKQISRTFPGLRLIFQELKNSHQPLQSLDLNINSPYFPPYTYFTYIFWLSLTDFQDFPGLSSPGKCQNKIPGLSRFSRTRTNPVWGTLSLWNKIYYELKNLICVTYTAFYITHSGIFSMP